MNPPIAPKPVKDEGTSKRLASVLIHSLLQIHDMCSLLRKWSGGRPLYALYVQITSLVYPSQKIADCIDCVLGVFVSVVRHSLQRLGWHSWQSASKERRSLKLWSIKMVPGIGILILKVLSVNLVRSSIFPISRDDPRKSNIWIISFELMSFGRCKFRDCPQVLSSNGYTMVARFSEQIVRWHKQFQIGKSGEVVDFASDHSHVARFRPFSWTYPPSVMRRSDRPAWGPCVPVQTIIILKL